jgi:histidyl-tRNA synthetase
MEINTESIRGTYDRYPDEWASWQKLISIVDETAEEFGFNQIDPPSIERQSLWTEKEEDSVTDEMYAFQDKGGRKITLIPEQTPTRARLIQKRKDLKTPIKWYNTSKRWRYEDVTEGRDREFLQGDFDIFGADSPKADAEIISAAARIFEKLGLEERVEFQINNRELLESILRSQGISNTEKAMKIVDDKEKMGGGEFIQELQESGLTRSEAQKVDELTSISGEVRECIQELEQRSPESASENIERLKSMSDALESHGVLEMCRLDLSIVRGLAYYTGTVFEAFDTEQDMRALFGGGRYNDLVGSYGSQEVSAVGFAFGYSPTVELLKKQGNWPLKQPGADAYVLSAGEKYENKATQIATKLRRKGVSTDISLKQRNFGEQLDYSDSINAELTIIVGEETEENGNVTIKDMDSGEQEEVGVEDAVRSAKNQIRSDQE